jgi:hypothetical protein
VPSDDFPQDVGLILADACSAYVVRPAPEHRMAATRRSMLLRYAHAAALRLQRITDPEAGGTAVKAC